MLSRPGEQRVDKIRPHCGPPRAKQSELLARQRRRGAPARAVPARETEPLYGIEQGLDIGNSGKLADAVSPEGATAEPAQRGHYTISPWRRRIAPAHLHTPTLRHLALS